MKQKTPQENHGINELDNNLFNGYISELEDGVIISHISAKHKGRGDFSRLLEQLKEKFNWIKVPTPSNVMIDITKNKGFIMREEFFPEPFNCMGVVMYWSKRT